MPAPIKSSRSIYAAKLGEFPEIVFADDAAFSRRGMWNDFFNARTVENIARRIVLEIGCFDAAFLCQMATKFPACAFIGLDWKCKAIYDGAVRISQSGLKNIALLRARAQDLANIFSQGEVDEILIFHPEPCDREVERNNRLLNARFLIDVHPLLRDSSSLLTLKTDHREYFQSVLDLFDAPQSNETLRQCYELTTTSADYWHDPAALAHTARRCFAEQATFYESRFIKKKKPIYFFELGKRPEPGGRNPAALD